MSGISKEKTSLLKAEKIAVIHESVFQRKLGNLPLDIMTQVQEVLKKALLMPHGSNKLNKLM